jgi:apolipoprotein N-acyltransferase
LSTAESYHMLQMYHTRVRMLRAGSCPGCSALQENRGVSCWLGGPFVRVMVLHGLVWFVVVHSYSGVWFVVMCGVMSVSVPVCLSLFVVMLR